MGVSQYQELKEHDDILQKALSIRDGGRDGREEEAYIASHGTKRQWHDVATADIMIKGAGTHRTDRLGGRDWPSSVCDPFQCGRSFVT